MTIRLTHNRIWQLSYGLSQRDLAVVATLSKVRVACVRQLERIHFLGQPRKARRVLAQLSQRRIVVRLSRNIGGVRAGSAGHVYALDVVGQSLSQNGGPAHGSRLRRPWTPGVRFLDHTLAVTDVYAQLVEGERRGVFELLEFQSEPEAWRRFSPMGVPLILKPDAFMRVGYERHEDSYFVEVDRGTESPGTLALKARMYERYYDSGAEQHACGVFPKVLWLVPDARRKEILGDALKSGRGILAPRLHEIAIGAELQAVINT